MKNLIIASILLISFLASVPASFADITITTPTSAPTVTVNTPTISLGGTVS